MRLWESYVRAWAWFFGAAYGACLEELRRVRWEQPPAPGYDPRDYTNREAQEAHVEVL